MKVEGNFPQFRCMLLFSVHVKFVLFNSAKQARTVKK